MLARVLEPEVEDFAADAAAYQVMDHRDVNSKFVDDLLTGGAVGPRVIDLGCGPGGIVLELAERWERAADPTQIGFAPEQLEIMGVDYSVDMLGMAQMEIELANAQHLVFLQQIDLTDPDCFQEDLAQTIISNTVLHHLPDPATALAAALKALMPGGRLFIRDLYRPETEAEIERLVEMHAGDSESAAAVSDSGVSIPPELAPKQLLRQSLWASLTLEEAHQMASKLGIPEDAVQMTSDRHWTLDWAHDGEIDSGGIEGTTGNGGSKLA
ncbi:class I SAM-dependent methyltransferase [Rhodopirellula sp. JC740]|uniref:Class I SAM-dependent methyltransferase n=1 Tax=Rhodopirellula halodulae TaxID=2894198 RepID=A0ABS8NP86_9BACT|nr:class I SAM-dependent methyltransferase [Rhodopirellula sp. JC740]MCC9645365.1 class I SAM-dependent methyltransferase [Rhodopirellula sp. JC740]